MKTHYVTLDGKEYRVIVANKYHTSYAVKRSYNRGSLEKPVMVWCDLPDRCTRIKARLDLEISK